MFSAFIDVSKCKTVWHMIVLLLRPWQFSLPSDIETTFSFHELGIDQFFFAFKRTKGNAISGDGIPLKFPNLILSSIAWHTLYIFNYCISHSIYPADWKKVITKPRNKVPVHFWVTNQHHINHSDPKDFCDSLE